MTLFMSTSFMEIFMIFGISLTDKKSLCKESSFATIHIKLSRTLGQFVKSITLCTELQKLQTTYKNKDLHVYYKSEKFHSLWTPFD